MNQVVPPAPQAATPEDAAHHRAFDVARQDLLRALRRWLEARGASSFVADEVEGTRRAMQGLLELHEVP